MASRLPTRAGARLAVALTVSALCAPGQQDPSNPASPFGPLDPRTQEPEKVEQPPQFDPILQLPSLDPDGMNPTDPDRIRSVWMRPEVFQGFPVFPPNLGGYGGYPTPPPGFLQPPQMSGQLPPPALPSTPDWPAWIKGKRPDELPYDKDIAVAVRQADRVWIHQAGDDAFVPLYHFDTTRGLKAGSRVQVRQTGEFLLLLHGGTRLDSFGAGDVEILALGDRSARLRIHYLSRMVVRGQARGIALELPDGSELLVDAPPDDPVAAAAFGTVHLVLERALEPGGYGGRATLFNAGNRPVVWNSPVGPRRLDPGFRVTTFLTPPAAVLPFDLHEAGVDAAADGARRRWTASDTGAVTWSGARFELQAGSTLEIDPLLGDPFAAPQAPAAPPQPTAPGGAPR